MIKFLQPEISPCSFCSVDNKPAGRQFQITLSEFSFERCFDERRAMQWMQANWSKSFVFSALYAALVFGGQHYMKPRPKMNLRLPLVLWSLSLALFSIIGAVRTGAYMFHVLGSRGFRGSICDQSFYNGPVSKFWAYAFVLSKAPELGDTAFVVLRKQKLLFLHWYHHITVLLYSWYSYKDMVAGGGWFMTMNYAVHALMYSYYAARAASLRVPRPLAVLITGAQISQMAMGLTVSALVYCWLPQGDCPSRLDNISWAALMYLSYLLLFSNFFYQTYLRRHDKAE
uniref:Elongation of very long chain fatty acids protein n=1 Tax=Mola mola TaxID=94237 RepID=A0A3Q3WDE9_MOLML